jgi:sigma-E factor negative regulatory protein RseB
VPGSNHLKLLLLLLAVAVMPAYAGDTAREWLGAMSEAQQSLNYDGTFVYLHDGKLEAMRIIHQNVGGDEKERLVSLTGSAREVIRDNQSVTCILPDSKSVMVGRSRPRQPFPVLPRDLESLEKYYRFENVGDDRMTGMLSRVVAVTPRDAYRYGYRFWISRDSKLLLKTDLIGADGAPIEQLMFTRLGAGKDVSVSAMQSPLAEQGKSWHHQDIGGEPMGGADKPDWVVKRLPEGFTLTSYQRKHLRPGGAGTEHMVYSDGLATVSVYVELASADDNTLTGLSSMGAMNTYGIVLGGHQVMVVGEVPAVTVKMMAHSIATRREAAND